MAVLTSILIFGILCTTIASSEVHRNGTEAWMDAMDVFSVVAFPLKTQFVTVLKQITENTSEEVSNECRMALKDFSIDLEGNKRQAMAMFDSFAKTPPGSLSMGNWNFGSYNQCLRYGRYVLMVVRLPLPELDPEIRDWSDDWRIHYSISIPVRRVVPFYSGICVPHECEKRDVETVFNSNLIKKLLSPIDIDIKKAESRRDDRNWSLRQLIAMSVLVSILLLNIISTTVSLICPDQKISILMSCFDMRKNYGALVADAPAFDDKNLRFNNLNIYRSVTIIVSTLTHTAIGITSMHQGESTVASIYHLSPSLKSSYRETSVNEVFFAGLIVTLSSTLSTIKWVPIIQHHKVSFMMFALMRALRSLPMIIFFYLFSLTLPLFHLASPLMTLWQEEHVSKCLKNGWKDWLLINNVGNENINDFCLPISWIMSVDFQLHCASFIILILICNHQQHAFKILSVPVALGIFLTGYKFTQDHISPVMTVDLLNFETMQRYFHQRFVTINFIAPYAIGMMFGLTILKSGGIARPVGYILSFLSFSIVHLVLSVTYNIVDEKNQFTVSYAYQVVYTAVARTVMAIAGCVLFYILINCQVDIVKKIANSRVVTILSRIMMPWYFVHGFLILMMVSLKESNSRSFFTLVQEECFIIVATIIPSCFLFVVVEQPFSSLVRTFFKTSRSDQVKKHSKQA